MADIQLQVPQECYEGAKVFLPVLFYATPGENQQIDIGVRVKLSPAIAADCNERDIGRGGKGVAVPDQGKNGIQGSGPGMDQCANISALPERFCICVVAFLQQLPGCYNR